MALLNPNLWVANYANQMYKYALMRVKYVEVAEDLVQETFISALKSKDNFSGSSSEKTWLFSILKFKLADYYRAQYKNTPAQVQTDEQFENEYFEGDERNHFKTEHQAQTWHRDIEQSIEQQEFQTVLSGCLKKTPTKISTVFSMKYLEDLDSKEICSSLGITESNFWVLMHRAKVQLRECLEKNWFVEV
jgi:RNA polymerase sigma-70 factor (ECF subfamily)